MALTRYRTVAPHRMLVPNPNFKPGGNIEAQPRLIEKVIPRGGTFETEEDMLRFNPPPELGLQPKFTLAEDLRIPTDLNELDARIKQFEAERDRILAKRQQPAAKPEDKGTATVAPAAQRTATAVAQLRQMTEQQLRDIAAEQEVDVSKCKGKEDLVRLLAPK